MTNRIVALPFILVGLIGSTLLALFTLPFAFNQFFSFWAGIYGLMLLLASPHTRSLQLLTITPIIPSFLAALPYYWLMQTTLHVSWSLIFFSSFALNAWQIQYQKNRLAVSYETLFHAVWDTFVKLCITAFFVLLCWIILWLCDQLFRLIQITLIHTLIDKKWFDIFVSGIFSSAGLYIASVSENVVGQLRTILFLICRYLLIPLSMIGIIFIVFLIIAAIQRHGLPLNSTTFITIAFLSGLFLNGIYQDGQARTPYPYFLQWICRIFLWITPLFILLALYALYLAGLNLYTFSDICNAVILLAYNLAYAIIAMGRQKPPFRRIEKTNVVLSVVLILATLLSTHPWIIKQLPKPQLQWSATKK